MFNTNKKGFTLVELIIVMALTLIILGMIFQMFNTNNRIMSDVDIKSTLQNEGQAIQEKLSEIGMQAISIECDGENDVKLLIINSLNESGEKCKFKIEVEKKEENKNENNNFYISEFKSNNNENGEILKSKRLFTDNLKKINVSQDDKSAELEIVLCKKRGYSSIEYPLRIKFTFRNKENKIS
ncbi:UNVERIFIED_ORG: prepilin-type cleavage/methylation domain-containing protein [Clostridium botulinum]|uniref:PilW family protein n=1 Tax=Clostridium botulinum TaxID=1491 RepID=UPI0007746A80|nr:prepilin-type N-terminal cleavage/methylation domain-containing protein [Clostridium botulinum]NFI51464.1 prepilin-type N-terminal cleavage/methylation domain-containing protein [Clostridium botulinum]NFO12418.1 prepilin-type N-terminal cleavage/methylation domain-containing protein [Clostridium botulinum]NFO31218.1 prepilin-type N-terminal cleavage/methylation domain-containing protein [Clostridium botulinum]NFO54389.1 prepilin-type N-terminal cleavage/methylation domain-containing protein 